MDLITAYSNGGGVAFELATALRELGKAQEADSSEQLSVRSTGRSERTWRVEDQLGETNLKLVIKQYQEGAIARELAEQYKLEQRAADAAEARRTVKRQVNSDGTKRVVFSPRHRVQRVLSDDVIRGWPERSRLF
ncbi:hypothetical protein [Saccharothrix saharensis]|uniref:hypothetical protein n=1 Tax=Saccharothrix saharensis TaxID=571190 RepID=UPI0011518EEF|nr:hypothetical protein [Saccharothrix saharensis]